MEGTMDKVGRWQFLPFWLSTVEDGRSINCRLGWMLISFDDKEKIASKRARGGMCSMLFRIGEGWLQQRDRKRGRGDRK